MLLLVALPFFSFRSACFLPVALLSFSGSPCEFSGWTLFWPSGPLVLPSRFSGRLDVWVLPSEGFSLGRISYWVVARA